MTNTVPPPHNAAGLAPLLPYFPSVCSFLIPLEVGCIFQDKDVRASIVSTAFIGPVNMLP